MHQDFDLEKTPVTNRQIFLVFFKVSKKYKRDFVLSFLTPLASIASNVLVLFLASKVLAAIATNSPEYSKYMLLLAINSLVAVIFNRVGFTHLLILQAKVLNDLSHEVLDKLLEKSVRYHGNRIGGKQVSDTADFLNAYLATMNALFTTGASFILTIVVGLTLVIISSWQLGVYLIATILIIGVWSWIDSRRRLKLRNVRHKATKDVVGHFSDTVVNAVTVKTFAQEDVELAQNRKLNEILLNLRVRDWHKAAINGNSRILFLLLSILGLLALLKYSTSTGSNIDLGSGIFAFSYTFVILIRLFEFNALTRVFEESMLSSRNSVEMLLEKPEIVDTAGAVDMRVSAGEICFNDITFMYADDDNQTEVFKNLNLKVKSGEKIGLVGPSGGGKSTLTKLLLRFDDIKQGAIEIDGQNIVNVQQKSLRQNIGYVPLGSFEVGH
jgi:ATP-binding cassette subfamily B protein